MKKSIFLLFPLFLCLFNLKLRYVDACGFTTHNVIAHRARDYFFKADIPKYQDIANKYVDALLGGAPFPDYLYQCGSDHSAGEAAHWAPFQAAAATYIRANKSAPWDEDTEKLVAFMFGVTSHYIADINWHGLGGVPHGYGFIQTLGIMDFNCTGNLCSTAHNKADTGGEFVAKFQSDLSFFEPTKWWVPVDDMINIFAMLNPPHKVNASAVDQCYVEFVAGALAIKELSVVAFQTETSNAPFLTEHYIDHPLGGIDDMAVWSARMWNRMAEWIEHGPPSPVPPPLDQRSSYNKQKHQLLHSLGQVLIQTRPDLAQQMLNHVHAQQMDQDNLRQVGKAISSQLFDARNLHPAVIEARTVIQNILQVDLLTNIQLENKKNRFELSEHEKSLSVLSTSGAAYKKQIVSDLPLEYLGYSMTSGDYNKDGKRDMVYSAYGNTQNGVHTGRGQIGSVYIEFGGDSSSSSSSSSTPSAKNRIDGTETNARFGFDIASLDFNMDGYDDLVVSSPLFGFNWENVSISPSWPYKGRVDVFYGNANASSTFSPGATPDYSITSNQERTQMGMVLYTADVNLDGHSDLLIGSPQAPGKGYQGGELQVFFASSSHQKTGQLVTDADADVVIKGDSFSHFASSFAIISNKASKGVLVIGAPGQRLNSGTRGSVFGYALPLVANSAPTLIFTIQGQEQQAKFGHTLAAGRFGIGGKSDTSMLAVSCPSADTRSGFLNLNGAQLGGEVLIIDVTDLPANAVVSINSLSSSQLLARLQGSHYGGRFGWSMIAKDINQDNIDDLLVSAPMKSEFGFSDRDREFGWTMLFQGGNGKFPSGVVVDCEKKAIQTYADVDAFGRMGHALLVDDLDGDGKQDIVISQPHRPANGNTGSAEMTGAIYVF